MKTYDHIIRFAVLIILVTIGFFIIRAQMVPESFGVHGSYTYAYYRADSEKEQAAHTSIYQGADHCSSCHEPQAALLKANAHATVDCESCHGSFKAHNNNTKDRMVISSPVDNCMLCHATLHARPADFPQIESFTAHLADLGEQQQPDMTCSVCHDPHAPM
jgi:hypothetical protein